MMGQNKSILVELLSVYRARRYTAVYPDYPINKGTLH